MHHSLGVSHVLKSDGGEFATVGTFIPMWVKHLEGTMIVAGRDLNAFKRFMRVVAIGGRLLMREFARIREVSEGDARQLRQLSIVQFVEATASVAEPKKKRKERTALRGKGPQDTI